MKDFIAGGTRSMTTHIIGQNINNDSRVIDFGKIPCGRIHLRNLCTNLIEQDIQSRRSMNSFTRQRVGQFQPQSLSYDEKDPVNGTCQIETLHTLEATLL